jgi:archaemetzincin
VIKNNTYYKIFAFFFLAAILIAHGVKTMAKEFPAMARSGKIYIVPMGDVKAGDLQRLCPELESEFHLSCVFADARPIPEGSYNKERQQYLSSEILKISPSLMPSDATRLLIIVGVDLYVPELNFVFGQASEHLKAAVISTYRLHQSFYRLREDESLFRKRLLTEAVHELGHTFGLGHCNNPHCVMYFSNTLSDTDRKGPHFCNQCMKKLKKE